MNSYKNLSNVDTWSEEEFGNAVLGNKARVNRLIVMAKGAANKPAGKITEAFNTSAEREGAYKFLENPKIDGQAISTASHVACAKRCSGENFIFVPVDGSSLSLADPKQTKSGLGPVGNRSKNGRGLEVMSAIAVRKDGTPLGICGQTFWAREAKKNKKSRKKRRLQEKETRFWFTAILHTLKAFVLAKIKCIPWFQLDRGADFRELLAWAADEGVLLTVRAAQNRRVLDSSMNYLWETVEAQPVRGSYTMEIPSAPSRKGRKAEMEVRTSAVTFLLPNPNTEKNEPATLYAVLTREVVATSNGDKPIEWMLLTNYAVETFEQACFVIYGYSTRWRIEEFHKTWKSVCRIEDSLLEESSRVIKWATIMSAVAMRIERLKYLSRNSPELPATEELSREEIDATIILRKPAGYKIGDTPSISIAVRWIADLGGYTGKSSGGPAGSIVIGRGLKEIAALARAMSEQNGHLYNIKGKN
jgi:hypothetical protein